MNPAYRRFLFRRLPLLLVVGYAGYALLVFSMQRTFIYPGTKLPVPASPSGIAAAGERVTLSSGAGGRFIKSRRPGRSPVILVFHGNYELMDSLSPKFMNLAHTGASVFLLEYPGYAGVPGKPTENSLVSSAVAAYDYVVSRGDVDPARVVAFGRSLGGGVACALTRHRTVRALVLQSTFTSLRPFASRYYVPGFLARDVFDNRKALQAYKGKILLLHGTMDRVVPYSHAGILSAAAPHAKLVSFDAGHSDILDIQKLWDEVAGLVSSLD